MTKAQDMVDYFISTIADDQYSNYSYDLGDKLVDLFNDKTLDIDDKASTMSDLYDERYTFGRDDGRKEGIILMLNLYKETLKPHLNTTGGQSYAVERFERMIKTQLYINDIKEEL